ncbi:unnamed protein product [Vitrella brassicaformis CCMP3155]|uniref:Protein kinase domain-containing protein n=1 Tax=Vitrella brassicaformis (strain CCMP3155) TaxID=1169540 RepID=A0A0G4EE52_VITBC|nr:unnamed protein product [Vitrella brassicaformis CCMP3155]|eukprot:CEL93619.1 unnamed protein product [Vitrella brassicaformis CCMP3155]
MLKYPQVGSAFECRVETPASTSNPSATNKSLTLVIRRPLKEGADGCVYDVEAKGRPERFVSKSAHEAAYDDEIAKEHQVVSAVYDKCQREGRLSCVPTPIGCPEVDTATGKRNVLVLAKLQCTLADLMDEYKRLAGNALLPTVAVLEILASSIEALESCHSAKVIHRDINLTNVMFPGRWGGRLRAMLIDMTRSLLFHVDDDQKRAKWVGRGKSMVSTFAYASKWSLRGYQQGPRDDIMAVVRCLLSCLHPTLTLARVSSSADELTGAYEAHCDTDCDHPEVIQAAEKLIASRATTDERWISFIVSPLPTSIRANVRDSLLRLVSKVEDFPFGRLDGGVYQELKRDIASIESTIASCSEDTYHKESLETAFKRAVRTD